MCKKWKTYFILLIFNHNTVPFLISQASWFYIFEVCVSAAEAQGVRVCVCDWVNHEYGV